jgi:hypothetical protein
VKTIVPDLELPAITTPDRPVPLVSSEAALRWRIAKHAGSRPLPHDKPQGEPFVWIDELPPKSKS